jgi:XTP/dITP diphosphohydrolase
MMTLVLATRNAHKAREIQGVLGAGPGYLSLRDFPDAPPVIEDAPTFAANAAKKARSLAQWLSTRPRPPGALFTVADDSGLEVDALNGAPGVHSARFAWLGVGAAANAGADGNANSKARAKAHLNASDAENNAKLLRLLGSIAAPDRTARFRCVIAAVEVPPALPRLASQTAPAPLEGPALVWFEGTCEGTILFAPRGTSGFGYDPLFLPEGQDLTFAELGDAIKNRISHRARALAGLRAGLVNARSAHEQP